MAWPPCWALRNSFLAYQNQAMRTLGFAYRVLEDDAPVFEDGRIIRKDLVYLGIAAISDPRPGRCAPSREGLHGRGHPHQDRHRGIPPAPHGK